jgi:OFA family oxalate/formate antiporter-like MFS transporter
VVFFGWGEIYSLFPATVTDTFGARYATANTGLMYTAKGTAALLVPVANVMMAHLGSWYPVFLTAAAFNVVAAALALLALKPLRAAYARRTSAPEEVPAATPMAKTAS